MAYPWELEGDDPLNYGLMSFGGALLTPKKQGGGLGPAVTALGQTVARQQNVKEQQELTRLKIDAYKKNLQDGVEEGDPAAWREWTRFSKLTPEQQLKYLDLKRQNEKIYDVGGVPTQRNLASGQSMPLSTVDEVASNKGRIAADIAYNDAMMKAGFKVNETVDANRQPTFNTDREILGNRVPQNPSAGFNAFQNAAQRAAGPPASQQDYPATEAGLAAARTDLAAKFPGNVMPPPLGNSGIRPASAGAAERAGESAASKGTSELYSTMAAAAVDAAEGNRALAKVSAVIENARVTGGPLATPEVIARNVLSEFGVPLNKGIDQANAKVSAYAATRLASKIIKGGRSLTDSDVKMIAAAFPGFQSGIPYEQLPDFIAAVKEMNDDAIGSWKRHSAAMTPEMRARYPGMIDDAPPKSNSAADLRKKYGLPPL